MLLKFWLPAVFHSWMTASSEASALTEADLSADHRTPFVGDGNKPGVCVFGQALGNDTPEVNGGRNRSPTAFGPQTGFIRVMKLGPGDLRP